MIVLVETGWCSGGGCRLGGLPVSFALLPALVMIRPLEFGEDVRVWSTGRWEGSWRWW